MKADFSGYATRVGIKCSDGRTIQKNAFADCDGKKVPLVWQHGHSSVDNVLGHAMLENREDGVYAFGFLNDSVQGQNAREAIKHGDIDSLSIYANQLQEKGSNVVHGVIREVSLVLSGANPGAKIDTVCIQHSDGSIDEIYDEAVIYSGAELAHTDGAQTSESAGEDGEPKELTVGDVLATFTEDQQAVLEYLLETQAEELQHSQEEDVNVFESSSKKEPEKKTLSHSQIKEIFEDASRIGSLKESFLAHAEDYGIDNIDLLFPDAKTLRDTPDFVSRRMDWVQAVLSGVSKTPFTRIKSLSADITHDEARAKGYIKGNMKKEEYFGLAKRETSPTTIYKKQKLDRDDILDITSLDVVAWLKAEMRIMLDEEIARAILVGDGRELDDQDKIPENRIRPIASDHEFYSKKIKFSGDVANPTDAVVRQITDLLLTSKRELRGSSGSPIMFMSSSLFYKLLVARDEMGRRLYPTKEALSAELDYNRIVPVDFLPDKNSVFAIAVDLRDYTVGTDKGGELSMFDDFDIDYNQHKYLYETRMSGALTKPASALVFLTSDYKGSEDGPSPLNHLDKLREAKRKTVATEESESS